MKVCLPPEVLLLGHLGTVLSDHAGQIYACLRTVAAQVAWGEQASRRWPRRTIALQSVKASM